MWIHLTLLILALLIYWIWQNGQFEKIKVDNHIFQLDKNSPNQDNALNNLVKIRQKLNLLVQHLLKKYPDNNLINRLDQRFKNTILREANPNGNSAQTSYTINKGDVIVLCMRTVNKKMVDFNTLMYVAIHELAHVYSSSYHHNPEFWTNMKFLIDEAIEIGIYNQTNYEADPVRYCGMTIASNIPENYGQTGGNRSDNTLSYIMNHSGTILAS